MWGSALLGRTVLGGRLEAMPSFTTDQVAHLASLARIALGNDEAERLAGELSAIAQAVDDVSEVATDDVPATSHPVPISNVFRDDVPEEPLTVADALSGAPAQEDGMFLVPRILGGESA